MRIFIISRGIPTRKYPGNGIFEYSQAKALAQLGHEIHYIVLDMRSIRRIRRFGYWDEEKDGIYIHKVDMPCGNLPIRDWWSIIELKKIGNRCINKYGRPALVHAHFTDEGYYSVKVFKKLDIPVVVTEHSSEINCDYIYTKRLFRIAKYAYEKADMLIAVGTRLADRIRGNFGVVTRVVPNVVDTFGEKKESGRNVNYEFLCVANLIKLKRINLLLECFAKVSEKHEDARLTIVGDGEERKNLIVEANKLGISDKVLFTGMLTHEEVLKCYAKANCFVLPSSSETFGVAYVEAISMQVPVIATKCGGPEDFVNAENGILIDVDSSQELYEAMELFISHRVNFDMKKQAEIIRRTYSPIGVAEQLTNLYKEICFDND